MSNPVPYEVWMDGDDAGLVGSTQMKDLNWESIAGKAKESDTGAIESIVRQFAHVKEQADALEQEKRRLKDAIEEHLAYLGLRETEIAGFKINVSDCSRENFNLKEAIAKIGRPALSPFISETSYTQLRIKRLAGE